MVSVRFESSHSVLHKFIPTLLTHSFINSFILATSKILLTAHKIKQQKQHPYVFSWLFGKREAFKQSADHSEKGLAKETNFLDPAEVSAKQL